MSGTDSATWSQSGIHAAFTLIEMAHSRLCGQHARLGPLAAPRGSG
jgi:hypothetical protein